MGHRVGGCCWGAPVSEVHRKKRRGGRGGAELDPGPGVRSRARSEPRGWETPGARGMEKVWGKREALSPAVGCWRTRQAGNIIHDTHTCWAICSAHSGASSSSRTPGRATSQTHTHIHPPVHMRAQTYLPHTSAHWGTVTSSGSASAPARSAAGTQPVATDRYNTIRREAERCRTHKHNLTPSCAIMIPNEGSDPSSLHPALKEHTLTQRLPTPWPGHRYTARVLLTPLYGTPTCTSQYLLARCGSTHPSTQRRLQQRLTNRIRCFEHL